MQLYLSDNSSGLPSYYSLSATIGKGKRTVTIYKGSAPESPGLIAAKVFSKTSQYDSSKHFRQEESIAKQLNHPNIIKYYGFHEDAKTKAFKTPFQGCSVILMEYLPHGDLLELVTSKKVNEKLGRTLFHQMIDAIEYLHDQGIAHLDIKLENFLVHPSGLKLIDYDFSHRFDEKFSDGMKGTPGYRPPELAKGELKDLIKADIYSLGVTLFNLVAGWSPYEEIEEETNRFIFDKFYDALRKETQSFWNAHNSYLNEDSREEFSEDFKNLFESMVCEDPEKRITIEDLKKDKWYNGEVFSPEELEAELKAILTL